MLLKICNWGAYVEKWQDWSLYKATHQRPTLSLYFCEEGGELVFGEESLGLRIQWGLELQRHPLLIIWNYILLHYIITMQYKMSVFGVGSGSRLPQQTLQLCFATLFFYYFWKFNCWFTDIWLWIIAGFLGKICDGMRNCMFPYPVFLNQMNQIFQPDFSQPWHSLLWIILDDASVASMHSKNRTLDHPQNSLLCMDSNFMVAVIQHLKGSPHGSF